MPIRACISLLMGLTLLGVSASGRASASIDCAEHTDTGYVKGSPFSIKVVTVDGKPVERATANAYDAMARAADLEGVKLHVVSGFRTMSEQQYLYGCHKSCDCNGCALAAKAGHSHHQSGHALDLNWRAPGVYPWLENNAWLYGFKRTVASEKWHWEWWGGGPGGGTCGEDCAPACSKTMLTTRSCESFDCKARGAQCGDEGVGPSCVGGSLDGKFDAPAEEAAPGDEIGADAAGDEATASCQLARNPRHLGVVFAVCLGLWRWRLQRRRRAPQVRGRRGQGSVRKSVFLDGLR